MNRTHLYIDHKQVSSGQVVQVRDPGRLSEIIGEVEQGTPAHVDEAVRSAHRAFQAWKLTSVEERSALLLQAADRLEQAAPTLAEAVSRENGMLLPVTRLELALAVAAIRNTVSWADEFFRPVEIEDAHSWVRVERKSIGVIAGFVPWNAPIVLTMQKLAPALLTGNTVVFKPSPFAAAGIVNLLNDRRCRR